MAQIRDTDIVQTPPVELDPRLFIPGDVIDIGVKPAEINPDDPTASPAEDEEVTGDSGVDSSGGTGDEGGDNPVYTPPKGDIPVENGTSDALPVPQSISIVSQTIRIAPDGSSLVDVVVDVSDLPGITNFDIRVTKA